MICFFRNPAGFVFLLLLLAVSPFAKGQTAAPASDDKDGYLVQLRYLASGQVLEEQITRISNYAERPARSAPAQWQLLVTDSASQVIWQRSLPAPGLPHLPAQVDGSKLFSLRIPAFESAARLVLRDEAGRTRWDLPLSEPVLSEASARQSQIKALLESSKASSDRRLHGGEDALEQMQHGIRSLARTDAEEHMGAKASLPVASELDQIDQSCGNQAHVGEHTVDPGLPISRGVPSRAERVRLDSPTQAEGSDTPQLPVPWHQGSTNWGYQSVDEWRSTQQSAVAEPKVNQVTLDGRVAGEDGQAFSSGFSIALFREGQFDRTEWVDQQGNFQINLRAEVDYLLYILAPLPYLRTGFELHLEDDANRNFEIERGVLVSGVVTPEDGGSFDRSFWVFPQPQPADEYPVWAYPVDQDGNYELVVDPGKDYILSFQPPAPYLMLDHPINVEGDSVENVELSRAVLLNGQVNTEDGESFTKPFSIHAYQGDQWTQSITVGQDGSFEAALESGSYRLVLDSPKPYLKTERHIEVIVDRSLEVTLKRGRLVSVDVVNEAGTPQPVSSVSVEQYGGGQFFYPDGSTFELVVERGQSAIVSVLPASTWFGLTSINIDDGIEDLSLEVVLERHFLVEGETVDSDGSPMPWAELRFYEDGRFIDSVLSIDDGSYNIRLPAGSYSVRAMMPDTGRYDSARRAFFLFDEIETTLTVGEDAPSRQDIVFDQPIRTLNFELPSLPVSFHTLPVRVYQDGRMVSSNHVSAHSDLLIKLGSYDLKVHLPSHGWINIDDVVIDQDLVLDLGDFVEGGPRLWTGVVRDDSGEPLANVGYQIYDDSQVMLRSTGTDEQGRFQLPLGPGLFGQIGGGPGYAVDSGLIMRRVDLDRTGSALEEDIVVESLDFHEVSLDEPGAQLLYGAGDTEDAINVVMLADGYTDSNESFEDLNGNGIWDGALYLDYNGNGVWDQGEPWAVYGDRSLPSPEDAGTDISEGNEPFLDLNGDGYPSFDDRTVFEMNARNFIQATLGSHLWEEYSDQFNFFVYFTPSEQAGMAVQGADGELLIPRDTFFDGNLRLGRGLLSANYSLAMEVAADVLPEYDQIVLLLNQPVPAGRANSFITYQGGMLVNRPDSRTPSHEFGHSVGFLADEYIEAGAFPDFFAGWEPSAFNVTTISDPEFQPWSHWMDPQENTGEPAIRGKPGVGLFTGGFYRPGGVFRPSQRSKMGSGGVLFNAPSEHATRQQISNPATLTGAWYDPDTSGQGFNFQFSSQGFLGYYYGYDSEGKNLWLTFDIHDGPLRMGQTARLEAFSPTSGVLGDPGEVESWGYLTLHIRDCARASAELHSHDGNYHQAFELELLVALNGVDHFSCYQTPDADDPASLVSGSWYDPATSGQGWNFLGTPFGLLGYFYGYDSEGEVLWLATDELLEDLNFGQPVTVGLVRGTGGTFEAPVGPDDLVAWGEVTFLFDDCRSGVAVIDNGHGESVQDLIRLVDVAGLPDCQKGQQ